MEEGDAGQKDLRELLRGHTNIMSLKCAVELGIADIIHSNASPMSLSQIASHIANSPQKNLNTLSCLMRFLARKNIFYATNDSHGEDTLYGLTRASRCLVRDSEHTLAPVILMRTHPLMMDPWHQLGASIREGGTPFEKANGCSVWELASTNPDFRDMFHNGLMCMSKPLVRAFMSVYKDGFEGVETVVDVGGGIGYLVAEIVKANWPRIKGVNFDVPYVFQNAPTYPGVIHQGGDMFHSIPTADVVIMKMVLHDWSDEDCMKILKNCKEAITKPKGKLILIETVLESEGREPWDEFTASLDLMMAVLFPQGRERTQIEWTKLLEDAGFCRIKFITTKVATSVIEAYPSS